MVFNVALAQRLLFITGYDYFYNGRSSPELLQAYDPALGGYIIQVEITSNMQVPLSVSKPADLRQGSRTMHLRLMVTEGMGHDVLPRFRPSRWR